MQLRDEEYNLTFLGFAFADIDSACSGVSLAEHQYAENSTGVDYSYVLLGDDFLLGTFCDCEALGCFH